MAENASSIADKLSFKRILIPILIGLAAATFLLVNNLTTVRFEKVNEGEGNYTWVDANGDGEINTSEEEEFRKAESGGDYQKLTYKDTLKKVDWTWYSTFWMVIALAMMAIRDLAYMYRVRVLTDNELTWRKSFDVIMLWEFASSITPSVVGGSGIAMFIINREGISMGKSTSVVLVTALLDELFYIIMVPVIFLLVSSSMLFPVAMEKQIFGITLNTEGIFLVGYFFIVTLTVLIMLAVFIFPRTFKYVLIRFFGLPFLRRWRAKAAETGDEIMITSRELKGKAFGFWAKAFAATFFSWTARYWVVNFILLAFMPVGDHFLVYARQLVMWVIMLISPTPGGSGIAEVAFSGFLAEFIPLGLAGALALLWRLLSYYPYLFIGAIILPRWLKRTGRKSKGQPNPIQG